MISQNEDFFGKPIFSYTRAQAINDGVLVDVSELAKEAGFTIPVAVTDTVWFNYIEWTQDDNKQQTYQNLNGRLWDVLSMLRFAIRKQLDSQIINYKLAVVPRDGKSRRTKTVQLKATIGAGDNSEPVITIMLTSED